MSLDGIIASNNLMVVKHGIENMTSKLLKQPKVNKPLVKQLQDDTERLNDSYVYLNQLKESNLVTSRRNKYLEGMLISNVSYTKDLNNKIKELEKQLKDLKQNIKL